MDVVDGLNRVAVGRGEQARAVLEDELVVLDVAVAQSQHEYEELVEKVRAVNLRTNDLIRERDNKQSHLRYLDSDIRELKRPREGFPKLDDAEYELRMNNLRVNMHGLSENLTKRSTWSE
jgi:hypothetical protein